ncbi:MAG: BACON domain-containing protein, partial [Alistipes sp.]|nr:BACON domain-containing protein [Alistipes sp.]
MKRLLLLLTTVSLILSSCEDNGGLEENNGGTPSIPKIELSQQSIDVGFEADIYAVSVTSPYSWKAVSDSDWIIIESKTGVTGTTELLFKT